MGKIRNVYDRIMFQPRIIDVAINPFYFSRRGLFKGISSYANHISGKTLDFGCGKKPYRNLFKSQEYIGLDLNASGHLHQYSQVDVFYDGEKIPFSDNHFDSAFSSEVFEHVPDLTLILKELHRVIRPGGRMLITVPFVWDEHETPYDFTRYTSFGIIKSLEKTGFKVISNDKTSNYVATIFQMWNAYVYQHIFPKNRVLKVILTPVFIAPVTILGLIISRVLPRRTSFFLNNVILFEKSDLI